MKADDINLVAQRAESNDGRAVSRWLQEIAHQLAVMNERNARRDQEEETAKQVKFDALLDMCGVPRRPQKDGL